MKYTFLSAQVEFFRFVVPAYGVFADPEMIRAIDEWLEPKTIRDVRSFHGLATFHRQFIKGFRTVMAPITDCLKKRKFNSSCAAAKAFVEIKKRMVSAPVMRLLNFSEVVEVACENWNRRSFRLRMSSCCLFQ